MKRIDIKQSGELPSAAPLNLRWSGHAEGNSLEEESNLGITLVGGSWGRGALAEGCRGESGRAASNKSLHRTAGRPVVPVEVTADTGSRSYWSHSTAAGELPRSL